MLTRETLLAKRAEYEEIERQAIANANAAHGAIQACDDLLALLDGEPGRQSGG